MQELGRLYGVSLGPGDPALITRQAWEILQKNAQWVYPVSQINRPSYALEILQRSGLKIPINATPLLFPMTHDSACLTQAWLEAASYVNDRLLCGQDVHFLVEGDASTYASFTYLARTLQSINPAAVIVTLPGISAYQDLAAKLNQPLACAHDAIAILPAVRALVQWDSLFANFNTIVLLKIKPHWREIFQQLNLLEKMPEVYFGERMGTSMERVTHDLRTLSAKEMHYLSLLMIKNKHDG